MAYKRTTQKFGNRRITTTYNNKTGKTTRSDTSAAKTKPGQTRVTSNWGNGKTTTTYTTNLGGGYYSKETSGGIEARRRKQQKESQQFWAMLFGRSNKTTRKKTSGSDLGGWLALGIIAFMLIAAFT